MANAHRSPQEYARLTLAVAGGAAPLDADNPAVDWLGYRVAPPQNGAARVNAMLLAGATLSDLSEARGGLSSHFSSLRRRFGCEAAGVDDPLVQAGGLWRFDLELIARMAGRPLPSEPASPVAPAEDAETGEEQLSSAGAGFGTAEQNRRVEAAAVEVVTQDYTARGWAVADRSREKLGYDLECRKGAAVERVEVKGVSGPAEACIVTAGEVRFAASDPASVVCLVTAALTATPKLYRYPGAEFSQCFDLAPVAYRARRKKSSPPQVDNGSTGTASETR